MPRGIPKNKQENTEESASNAKKPRATKRTSLKNPLERDCLGLLPNIKYEYSSDGFIDWKRTVPVEHLFPNKERFKKLKKEVPSKIEDIDDENLLIKLSGLKWAARVRGYISVNYDISSEDGKCTAKCQIFWIPNFETNGETVCFEDVGSATSSNCDGFAKNFLESIAANRAFARCVRNFLNINIVSDEEIGPEINESQNKQSENSLAEVTPQAIFMKVAEEKLGSLDKIVQFVNRSDVDTDGISSIEDLKSRITVSAAKLMLKELNQTK